MQRLRISKPVHAKNQARDRIYSRINRINPRKAKLYANPTTMISYLRSAGLYDGLRTLHDAVIVYTTEWPHLFSREIGPPIGTFFDLTVHRWKNLTFILKNVTPGGQTACHHLEQLRCLGVRRVIALGHCGALSSDLEVGDIVIQTRALRGESVSDLYLPPAPFVNPSPRLTKALELTCLDHTNLKGFSRGFACGVTYTTESMFREPAARLEVCRNAGILTVETEAASIFALGRCRKVEVASLGVISNLVKPSGWKLNVYSPETARAKRAMIHIALGALTRLQSKR